MGGTVLNVKWSLEAIRGSHFWCPYFVIYMRKDEFDQDIVGRRRRELYKFFSEEFISKKKKKCVGAAQGGWFLYMPARMQAGLGTPFKTRRSASSRVTPTFSGITDESPIARRGLIK